MAVIGEGYFTVQELEQVLRTFFPYDEMFTIDFRPFISQMEDYSDYYRLEMRGRVFRVDKVTGSVVEVTGE